MIAVHDNRRVAVQHGRGLSDCTIDTVSNLLEVEESGLTGFDRGVRTVVGLCPYECPPRQSARGRDKPGGLQSPKDLPTGRSRRSDCLVLDREMRLIRQAVMVVGLA